MKYGNILGGLFTQCEMLKIQTQIRANASIRFK